VLMKSVNAVGSGTSGSSGSTSLMGSSLSSTAATPIMTPSPPPYHPEGDLSSQTFHPFSYGKGTNPVEGDSDHRCH
jgi:hypothetical protein